MAIMIYAQDRDYLFADTTYFLEQRNLTIVDAYIVPTQREYTIASYIVLEGNTLTIPSVEQNKAILDGLKQALLRDNNSPFCPIHRHIPRQLKHFPVPTRVTFNQDYINNHTVMELITTDRPGVLSRLAQAFTSCNVRLKKAKIATFGSRVEDIFFITDYENNALYSTDQLDCLREKLSRLLDEDMHQINE
jgi:[protein-PII] uridylyltransferase